LFKGQREIFIIIYSNRLELPTRKSIGIKANPTKIIKDVLKPILQQYGCLLENCLIEREVDMQTRNLVELTDTVASIDNTKLTVLQK